MNTYSVCICMKKTFASTDRGRSVGRSASNRWRGIVYNIASFFLGSCAYTWKSRGLHIAFPICYRIRDEVFLSLRRNFLPSLAVVRMCNATLTRYQRTAKKENCCLFIRWRKKKQNCRIGIENEASYPLYSPVSFFLQDPTEVEKVRGSEFRQPWINRWQTAKLQ